MGFRMVKIFLTSDDPQRSDSNISRDVLFCLQNSVLFINDIANSSEILKFILILNNNNKNNTQICTPRTNVQ